MIKKFLLRLKRVIRQNLELSELAFFMLWRQRGRADDRVLVIHDSHLGDFVLSITFFQRLQKHYQRKLVLVSDGGMKDLAMASGLFEDFIALDMKKASSLKHSLYRCRGDLAQLKKFFPAVKCYIISVFSRNSGGFKHIAQSFTFFAFAAAEFTDNEFARTLMIQFARSNTAYADVSDGT